MEVSKENVGYEGICEGLFPLVTYSLKLSTLMLGVT